MQYNINMATTVDFTNKEWLLEDVLHIHKLQKDIVKCKVKLNLQGLSIKIIQEETSKTNGIRKNNEQSVPAELLIRALDIIGYSDKKTLKKCSTVSSCLTLFTYPPVNSMRKTKKWKPLALTLEFGTEELQQNQDSAALWGKGVQHILANAPADGMTSEGKLLVLINPNSGPGKAYQIFRKQVVPVLSEAGCIYDVIITTRANHARNLVRHLKLDQYRAIAVVAGDGLLYEVYNGLGERPDWPVALRVPVCIVPGGSGNGLAKSLAHWRGEPEETSGVVGAALNLVRGVPAPMDLVFVYTQDGERLVSFLSLGLGLLADIDIESERLRMLGEARFTVWALARIAMLRRYSVTVSFKRAPGHHPMPSHLPVKKIPVFQRSQTIQEDPYFSHPCLVHQSSLPQTGGDQTQAKHKGQHRPLSVSNSDCYLQVAKEALAAKKSKDSRKEETNDVSSSSSSSPSPRSFNTSVVKTGENTEICIEADSKTNQFNSGELERNVINATNIDIHNETNEHNDADVGCSDSPGNSRVDNEFVETSLDSPERRRKKTSTAKGDYSNIVPRYQETNLSDYEDEAREYDEDDEGTPIDEQNENNEKSAAFSVLSEPVPEDWITISGEFVMVYAVYQSHISTTCMFAPSATPDDGVMWLLMMDGDMTRANVLKFMLSLDSGAVEGVEGVRVEAVTGLRLEPHDNTGVLTVDGERVPYQAVHAHVMPGAARVLVR